MWLRSLNLCRTMLQMFYPSVIANVIFYAVVSWGCGLRTADVNLASSSGRQVLFWE